MESSVVTTSYESHETVESTSFLEPTRYRVRYECARCGRPFTRTYKVIPSSDPPCPREACRVAVATEAKDREIANLRAMLASRQPPAHTGANNQVRAVDATADIVMQDYGMTNLQDNVRHGDAVAPKLPVAQQQAADNYFAASGRTNVLGQPGRSVSSKRLNALGRRALAGSFRNMAVAPAAVTPDAVRGQPALTVVRTEPLQRPR